MKKILFLALCSFLAFQPVAPADYSINPFTKKLDKTGASSVLSGEILDKTWELIPQDQTMNPSGVTFSEVNSMTVYKDELYIGYDIDGSSGVTRAPVYKWDGTKLTFLSDIGTGTAFGGVTFLQEYKGDLYAGIQGASVGNGDVYVSTDSGLTWTKSFENTTTHFAYSATVFKGKLYVGLGYSSGTPMSQVYSFDGTTWTQVYAGLASSGLVVGMKVYDGRIFLATGGTVSAIISSADGLTWTVEASVPNTTYLEFNHFEEFRGKLYANVIKGSGGTNDILVRSDTGVWKAAASALSGSQCWGMNVYNDVLYVGCSQAPNGAIIFKSYDGVNFIKDFQSNTLGTSYEYEAFKAINYNGSMYWGFGGNGSYSANLWRKTDSIGKRFDTVNKFLKKFWFNTDNSYPWGNDESKMSLKSPISFKSPVGINTSPTPTAVLAVAQDNSTMAATGVATVEVKNTPALLLDNSAFTGVDEAWDNTYEAIKFTAPFTGNYGIACVKLKSASTQTNPSQTFSVTLKNDSAGSPGSDVASSSNVFTRWGSVGTSYTDVCFNIGTSASLTAGTAYWVILRKYHEPNSSVTIDCAASGTNTHAYSANGSAWTTESNKDCSLRVYARSEGVQRVEAVQGGSNSAAVFTSTSGTAIQATTATGNGVVGTASATGQGGFFTANYNNAVLARSDHGVAYLTQTIAGVGLYSPQSGTLIADTNAPNIYALRSNTIGSFNQYGPIMRGESSVADVGDLFQLYKQTVPRLVVESTGKTTMNATGGVSVVDTASLGSEKVTNGTFTGNATGWTLGAGWAYSSNNVAHTAGSTAAMSQDTGEVAGEYYLVSFVVSVTTGQVGLKGKLTTTIGGTQAGIWANSNGNLTASGYFSNTVNYIVKATNTNDLTFTPTTDFNGTIDTVSVKKITDGDLEVVGDVRAGNYFGGAGTQGMSGTCTLAGITTITVEDGLITACA